MYEKLKSGNKNLVGQAVLELFGQNVLNVVLIKNCLDY